MTEATPKSGKRWGQFSIKFMLLLILLTAVYFAGWTSNERWRQMQEAADGNLELEGPVQIEYIDASNVIVTGGRQEDVERVQRVIERIEKQPPTP